MHSPRAICPSPTLTQAPLFTLFRLVNRSRHLLANSLHKQGRTATVVSAKGVAFRAIMTLCGEVFLVIARMETFSYASRYNHYALEDQPIHDHIADGPS